MELTKFPLAVKNPEDDMYHFTKKVHPIREIKLTLTAKCKLLPEAEGINKDTGLLG